METNREAGSMSLNEPYFDEEATMLRPSLNEPHFDEATLLSARPVVPLEVVRADARSGRRLAIGLVAVVALLIGAFGATLIYKLRSHQQTTELTEVDQSAQPASPIIESGVTAVESSPQVRSADDNPPVRAATVQTVATKPQLRVSKKDQALEQKAIRDQEVANRREQEKRERWEERRPRRVRRDEKQAWRKDDRRDARARTDAWRIREIFEGAARP